MMIKILLVMFFAIEILRLKSANVFNAFRCVFCCVMISWLRCFFSIY
jgi:hypothetical protein